MNSGSDSRLQLAGWLLAAAFPVLALVLDKAASTIFAIFFLAGLWLLLRRRAEWPDPAVRWVLIAFAAYFLVGVLSFAFGEHTRLGEKLLGRDIRFLGAVAVYFTLARLALPERWLRFSLVGGGLLTGLVAIVETWLAADPDYRAGGETISIVFGHLSVALFAANLALALFERRGRGLAIIAALFAVAAVALSGTRGAWLSVVAVLGAGFVMAALRDPWWRRGHRLAVASLLSVAVIGAGLAWLSPRLADGWRELQAYVNTSQPAAAPRGCIGDRQTLRELTRFGEARGVDVNIVARAGAEPGCTGQHVIRIENRREGTATWVGPYRSLPVGAESAVLVRGQGRLDTAGADGLNVHWRTLRRVALPPVIDATRTALRVRVSPGETLWFAPLETHAGEYAFAAAGSSVGTRVMMWSAAVRRLDAGLLGGGPGSWPLIAAEEASEARAAWRLAAYDHPHSDYLTVLLERGWLGLAALLGVFAAPLAWSVRGGRAPDWRRGAVALVVTATAVSALTETVFNHSIGITYYCGLVLLLLTARPESPAR